MTTTTTAADIKPFADRAWNQTSAKACSLQLLWQQQMRVAVLGRPDRILSLDRRNRGSALHDAARLALRLLFDKGKWPNAERTLRAVLQAGGGEDVAGDEFSFMKGKGYRNLWDVIGELVPKVQLFTENFTFSADDRIGSEHFVAVDAKGQVASFWNKPAGGFHGRIDWAELSQQNQLRVIDFKNRPAIHPKAEILAHEQLSFYAWMLAKHYPQARSMPAKIGIYYFEYGVTDEVEVPWQTIDENVERLMAKIRRKQALRIQDIEAEPGFGRCQYCEYLGDCPDGLQLLAGDMAAPVDAESALRVAKGLFVLDEIREAARDGLKAFCEEHGPVMISDDTGWGFKRQPENEFNVQAIVKVIDDSGLNKWDVLRVDLVALKKLRKDNRALDEAIEPLIKVARYTTPFKCIKPKSDAVVMTPMVREKVRRAPKEKKPKKNGVTTMTPRSKKT